MFDLFKNRPKDVKEIRNCLLQFIKEQLQKTEGGEGGNITGIYLFINCNSTERHLYESAVYADIPERFKMEEVQRIADDYAIRLPSSWKFETVFTDALPAESTRAKDIDAALFISTQKIAATHKKAKAFVKVLNGVAEKQTYLIDSSGGKVNIGREASVQTADGFFRKNFIAFISSETNDTNRSISRQHAHIEWEPDSGSFFLFADEGGIPPFNKMKVRSVGGTPVKMQATEIGHRLEEGDQIILGESAVLEFTYSGEEK